MRVLPVAKRNTRRACSRAFNGEDFVKIAKRLGAQPIRPPQGRSKVGTQRPVTKHSWKKHMVFLNTFFSQNTALVASWAPAAQGPSLAATFYAYCLLGFYFCKLHTFSFFGPVSVFFAQEGPPNEFFGTFFGSVFGRARVQISNVPLLRSVFFAASKKCVQKIP